VADTGIGMTPEVRARIFEPFFTTKSVDRGTGLGLAVVHGIVQQAGGHIEVMSEPGAGTVFRITLPTVQGPGATAVVTPLAKDVRGRETVLVVEDEALIRGAAVRALRGSGYRVFEAGDGEEALGVLDGLREPIDLLLTDVVMPRMDGRELAEIAVRRVSGIRVLYTSGYTDYAVLLRGISTAYVAFLPKPYTRRGLLECVRLVLDAPAP